MAGAGENKHFNSGSAGGAHPALSKPIFCARAEARPPQGRRRRGLGPICEPMALDRFSDNEVPGSGRRPHDKLISVYDRLSLAEQQALLAALDRGWGKAVQHTEAEISVYDSLSLDEQQALLAILESLDAPDEEGDSSGAAPTHH